MPAPVVNGGGDRLRKVQFSELQKPPWPWPWHTVVHRSSTSIPNFTEIGQTFCGRMDVLLTDISDPL